MRAAAVATLVVLAIVPAQGQTETQRGTTAAQALKARSTGDQKTTAQWRTPWGDPDLQGTWSNQTLTPLERPAEFKDKPVLTEAEATAY